jgi:hypothetical protein
VLALEQSPFLLSDTKGLTVGHSTCEKVSFCSGFLRSVLRILMYGSIVFGSGEAMGKKCP